MALDEDLEFKSSLESKGYTFVKRGHIGQIWCSPNRMAVKIIDPYLAENKKYDFEASVPLYEQMVNGRIRHQNIVEIYGINNDQNVTKYDHLVMEFVDGSDIEEIVGWKYNKSGEYLSAEESITIALQILDGLKYLHENGIPHGDLHSGNIIITKAGKVKITDIGGPNMTVSKAGYASPEQWDGEMGDKLSDFYTLGRVLQKMLTNRLSTKKVKDINPSIPQNLEDLILKLTKEDKRERYQSADEVIKDLRKVDYGLKGFRYLGEGLLGPSYLSPQGEVVKVLGSDPQLVETLSSLRKVNHPNILKYIEKNPIINEFNLQREYVEGKSIEDLIKEKGKFAPRETLDIIKPVAEGLDYAEMEHDLVHGNVKPSNIIIGRMGTKVVDFLSPALVQEAGSNGRFREQERQYFHPAVLNGEMPTHQTDIYSMGAIAFRMISGEPYRPGKRLNLAARGDKEFEELILRALII